MRFFVCGGRVASKSLSVELMLITFKQDFKRSVRFSHQIHPILNCGGSIKFLSNEIRGEKTENLSGITRHICILFLLIDEKRNTNSKLVILLA